MIDVFIERFKAAGRSIALITDDASITYQDLLSGLEYWQPKLIDAGIRRGDVVLLKGDFSTASITGLFALFQLGAIVILLAPSSYEKEDEFTEVGQAQFVIDSEIFRISKLSFEGQHALYDSIRSDRAPGVVFFSSGSTGASKGTVHNAARLMEKFRNPGKNLRTLAFLLFDHIAGIDTLFYSLANQSTLVLTQNRSPDFVASLIDRHKVEVLPTAPSFLNLLMLSGAPERHDLSSLKIITYGSEMMAQSTLERCAKTFPFAKIIQKYGTSETGALSGKSKSNTSTWIKLGGNGVEWRVVDDKFEIKANTTMLGYLNAPSPFTDDGYFKTGDRVEQDGEYVRFLGRDSDIINIGGQKVFPAEIENLLRDMDEVADVAVYGQSHPILGAAVVAKILPKNKDWPAIEARKAVRAHLSGKIEGYKIPQKILLTDEALTTSRFKQIRKA